MLLSDLSLLNFAVADLEPWDGPPTAAYLIAATQRSGSNWLCRLLWNSGQLGAPHEYFNEVMDFLPLATRFGAYTPDDYLLSLYRRRTTPNGVFGCKVLFNQWDFAQPFFDLLRKDVGTVRILSIERSDKVAQAVSFARAMITKQWTSAMRSRAAPAYNADLIKQLYLHLLQDTRGWERVFREQGWTPLRLTYEEVAADRGRALRSVHEHIGTNLDAGDLIRVRPMERQGDEVNSDWVERFRAEEQAFLFSADGASLRPLPALHLGALSDLHW